MQLAFSTFLLFGVRQHFIRHPSRTSLERLRNVCFRRRHTERRIICHSLSGTSQSLRQASSRQLPQYNPSKSESASSHAQKLVTSGQLDESDAAILSAWTSTRAALLSRVLTNRTRHITFVLDGVHGAHNLAAIVRTSDAWGVQNLHFISSRPGEDKNSKPALAPHEENNVTLLHRFDNDYSVKSVSKNAQKWLTMQEHRTSADAIRQLKAAGYKLYVSSLSTSAMSVENVDISEKCAFVFGNETLGVSEDMQQAADAFFTIPMVGFVESMNVSVAVATTASLTIPRCRVILPPNRFYITANECRQLAHSWLRDRPRAPSTEKEYVSKGDVTRLGSRLERRILEKGVFVDVDFPSQPQSLGMQYWSSILCLHGETGGALHSYMQRRKFGVLGDKHWDRRCCGVSYFVAGAHALTCASTLSRLKVPCNFDRATFMRFFQDICKRVNALYEPYFDSFGSPKAPPNVPEADRSVRRLSKCLRDIIFPVVTQYANDVLQLPPTDTQYILETVDIQDICLCVAETLCLPETVKPLFVDKVTEALPRFAELQTLLANRDKHGHLPNFPSSTFLQEKPRQRCSHPSDSMRKVVLHVVLRMSNAAFLTSELHQAVWDRASDLKTLRIRSILYNFPEAFTCDTFSEMELLGVDEEMALLRVVMEWYRLIWILNELSLLNDQ